MFLYALWFLGRECAWRVKSFPPSLSLPHDAPIDQMPQGPSTHLQSEFSRWHNPIACASMSNGHPTVDLVATDLPQEACGPSTEEMTPTTSEPHPAEVVGPVEPVASSSPQPKIPVGTTSPSEVLVHTSPLIGPLASDSHGLLDMGDIDSSKLMLGEVADGVEDEGESGECAAQMPSPTSEPDTMDTSLGHAPSPTPTPIQTPRQELCPPKDIPKVGLERLEREHRQRKVCPRAFGVGGPGGGVYLRAP